MVLCTTQSLSHCAMHLTSLCTAHLCLATSFILHRTMPRVVLQNFSRWCTAQRRGCTPRWRGCFCIANHTTTIGYSFRSTIPFTVSTGPFTCGEAAKTCCRGGGEGFRACAGRPGGCIMMDWLEDRAVSTERNMHERPRARLPGLPVIYEYSKKGWWEVRKRMEPTLKWSEFEEDWERISETRMANPPPVKRD